MLIINEAAAAIRRTPLLSALTALVIAISLALVGIFALLSVRATETLNEYRSNLPIEAYFDPALSSDSAQVISSSIVHGFSDLDTVIFISKAQALQEYTASSGDDIKKIVGYNPLPAGIRMTFRELSIKRAAEIETSLKTSAFIKAVLFDPKALRSLEDKEKTLLTLTYSLGIFLVVVSVLLAASLARLAMQSRREAIRAMSLLGASRNTIVLPYYIEGIVSGFFGGLIAAGAIIALYVYGLPRIAPELLLSNVHTNEALILTAVSIVVGSVLGLSGAVITSFRLRLT